MRNACRHVIAAIGILAATMPALTAAGTQTQAPPAAVRAPGPLGITAEPTATGYLYRIPIGNSTPEQVQVQVAVTGGALLIVKTSQTDSIAEESSSDGRNYRHSAQGSSRSMRQLLPLPTDADATRMTQRVADGAILVHIPHRAAHGRVRADRPATPATAPHASPTPHP
jgi:hypothetical protein